MGRSRASLLSAVSALVAACSTTTAGRDDPTPAGGPSAPTVVAASSPGSVAATAAPPAASSAPTEARDAGAPAASAAPRIAAADALDVLFPDPSAKPGHARVDPGATARSRCFPDGGGGDGEIRCLIEARYEGDAAGARTAVDMFAQSGSIAGLEREQDMDGGFRGRIHLVPELPVGHHARHLGWVAAASRDFEAFFGELGRRRPSGAAPPSYRWRSIAYRFFRSVGRTTPSAYATGWTVAYNVSGSLHGSADAVRETLFHEIFHLNDAARGGWSRVRLGASYDSIVARCGTKMPCLAPYAPNSTTVRGGTYYAFQPDNGDGVAEYAAELAIRWYREHAAVLAGRPPASPFKCGPAENARAWQAVVDEFFGGADLVAACR